MTIPFDKLQQVGSLLLSHFDTLPFTLRKNWHPKAAFFDCVQAIQEYGYQKPGHKSVTYHLDINESTYWVVDKPVSDVLLISRDPRSYAPAPYDAMAAQYDRAFSDPASLEENRQAVDLIGIQPGQTILDIGCGTGLLIDTYQQRWLRPCYTGIEPSAQMLAELTRKHPWAAERVIKTGLEQFVGGPYDQVISLFGSPAYIDPAALYHLPLLLNPGGSYFLMFLAEGYRPVAYERTGVEIPYQNGVTAYLPGTVTKFNNYLILQGQKQ